MFLIKWALKSIRVNKYKSMRTLVLFVALFVILITGIIFLEGANRQMQDALRYNYGDLNVNLRDSASSLEPITAYITENYGACIRTLVKSYSSKVTIAGEYGFSDIQCTGMEDSFLPYLNKVVGWRGKEADAFMPGAAYVSTAVAGNLNLEAGDTVTLRVRTAEGMINTSQCEIAGIFTGTQLIYGSVIFIPLGDMQRLFLTDGCNSLNLYFNGDPRSGKEQYLKIYQDISRRFFKSALTDSLLLYPENSVIYTLFMNIRILLNILFIMVIIIACYILYFSIQNNTFINFRKRKNELSTLLTYGMKVNDIVRLTLIEAACLFLAAIGVTAALIAIETFIVSGIRLVDSHFDDFITVLGGPRIVFAFNPLILGLLILFLFAIVVFSTYRGIMIYMKLEVREIISHV